MKWRDNVLTALLAAALCVMAPMTVPLSPVPITLATLGVYLAAGLLGPWRGAAAVGLYLLLGAVGVPVFAGFSAGFPVLFGLTGGFLWGYLPAVLIVSLGGGSAVPWRSLGRITLGLGRRHGGAVRGGCGVVYGTDRSGSRFGTADLRGVHPARRGD